MRVSLGTPIKSNYVGMVDLPHQQRLILQGFNIKIPCILLNLAPIDLFEDFGFRYSLDG
jgi:hypothetical protein